MNPVKNLKVFKMKTLNFDEMREFVLSNEEMINVRGGNDGDPKPPIIVLIPD